MIGGRTALLPGHVQRPQYVLWEGRRLPLSGHDHAIYYRIKRAMDVVVATLALVFLAPLMLAILAGVRLTSPGPAIFAQERWGSRRRRLPNGAVIWEAHVFRCLKFRTMTDGADPEVHIRHVRAFVSGQRTVAAPTATVKLCDDRRITGLGRFLRLSSLDELPQLVNVVRGEMSLVGPRPVPLYEVASYPGDWCLARLGALPGLTCTWQVHGRCGTGFDDMIRMDLDYVRRPSLRRDIVLLCQTVPCLLMSRGAR